MALPPPPDDPLGRIGGMLLRPRAVLAGTLESPGRTGSVMVAVVVVVGLLLRPEATARAILLIPVAPAAGVGNLVQVLAATLLWELLAVVALGSVLEWVARRRGVTANPEGVFAALALCLVPMLVLSLVGALLRESGATDLFGAAAWLAARLPPVGWGILLTGRGDPGLVLFRAGVAHLPTLLLMGWFARTLLRNRRAAAGETG
jgi:hypothetical protein